MIQPVKEKIILGIDPGTNIMGYGVLKVTGVKPEVMTLGVIDLRKCTDSYLKLKHIYERVQGIIASYLPDELAIEAPFFGKNVQSMLKLGRAQGVAIVAALTRDIPVTEYAPLKIKMAITGNGQASKGAGSRYAEAHAAHTRLGNGPFYGCDGCFRSGLLPLFADGTSGNAEKAYSKLEGFHCQESGTHKEIGDYNHEFKTAL